MSRETRPPELYFLCTERLGFRTWRPDDLPLAMELWGDPKVTALIDTRGQLSKEQVRERLEREIATMDAHGVQYWPVFLLSSNEFAGCCGLRPYQPDDRIYELGVHLRPSLWGGGYALEACHGVVDYAFQDLGAAGLFAGHNPTNERSRRLLEKLGFRYTHDELYPATGLRHPSYRLTAGQPRGLSYALAPEVAVMSIEERVKELGLVLPEPFQSAKPFPFSQVRVRGRRAVLSGHLPLNPDGGVTLRGKVGAEITPEEGYAAARACGLAMLASLRRELGSLDRIEAWVRVLGMVNAAPGFTQISGVVNGFSELLIEVFGPERGGHARSAVGMAELPFGVPVEVEAEVELREEP